MSKTNRLKGSAQKTSKHRKHGKTKAASCKSIHHSPHPLSSMEQALAKQVGGLGSNLSNKSQKFPNTKSDEGTRFDANAAYSKKMHSLSCKKYSGVCFSALEFRRYPTNNRFHFEALLGKGGQYADCMPSSDLKLRKIMGNYLIDEVQKLYRKLKADPTLKAYHITFVGDRYMFNERGGTADVFKIRQAVQAALRNYTTFNAIGVIENQAIINYPQHQKGKMLSVHAHVICWGKKNDVAELKRRVKGFKSSITKLAIHSKKIHLTEGSIGKLTRYLVKPPSEGKEVNFAKLEEGQPCLRPARRMEKHHHLRLFEYSAKLPMENILFGVGDGAGMRKRVVSKMKRWQKQRKGREIKLEGRLQELFETFLEDNKGALRNYKPLKVNYRREHCKKR